MRMQCRLPSRHGINAISDTDAHPYASALRYLSMFYETIVNTNKDEKLTKRERKDRRQIMSDCQIELSALAMALLCLPTLEKIGLACLS